MKKKDFKQELITPKYRVDNNLMRSYMRKVLTTEKKVKMEIADIESLLDARCDRHGIITLGDNIDYLKTANGFELIKGIEQSLVYLREEINKYRQNFADDLTFWSEVEKDWNNQSSLLVDLNEIENFNLSNYLYELKKWLTELYDAPKEVKRKIVVTMNSKYDEDVLIKVYKYLRATKYWANDNIGSRDFIRIFKISSVDGIAKLHLRNVRGCKAFVRALVNVLVGTFDAKIVNLCFCDENGKSLRMAINDRPSKVYEAELNKIFPKPPKC